MAKKNEKRREREGEVSRSGWSKCGRVYCIMTTVTIVLSLIIDAKFRDLGLFITSESMSQNSTWQT